MSAFERLVDKLRDEGKVIRETGEHKALIQCPAHDDNDPSLSVTGIEGSVLVYCHGHCDTEDVLASLSMTKADLFDDPRGQSYRYDSTAGVTVRTVTRTPDKKFRQKVERCEDGSSTTLYRAPELSDAHADQTTVYLVEGEKDVHALESLGLVATTAPMGSSNIGKADLRPLVDLDVVAVVDKDDAGKKWATIVEEKVGKIAKSLSFVEAATGKDAADHVAAGHGVENFVELEVEDEEQAAEDELLTTLRDGAWLDRQVFPPLAWAVFGLLPEGFGLFTGAPKAGKSWAALGIALAVSDGSPALGSVDTGEARPVLLLALEDGDRRLQGRCRALLDDAPIPANLDYQTSTSPQLVIPLIRAWLRKHGHQRPLVVLDTLGKVMPPALPGEGAYQRDYRIGSQLKRLVDEHPGSCLLVVHHTRKAGAEDWMDSTSGTNGLNGAADWTANLSRPRNEDRGVLRVTGRDVPEGEYAIKSEAGRWTIEGDALADAAKVAAEAKMTADLGDRSAEILNYVTKLGEVTAKQVCDALDLPDARRYLARLHDAGKLAKPKRGTYTPVPSVPMPQPDEGDWDKGTDGTPGQAPDVDDRPTCPTCPKHLMGREELAAGQCIQCRRVASYTDPRSA